MTVSTDRFFILSIFVATEACLIFVNFGSLPHALSSPLKRYAKTCVNLRQNIQNFAFSMAKKIGQLEKSTLPLVVVVVAYISYEHAAILIKQGIIFLCVLNIYDSLCAESSAMYSAWHLGKDTGESYPVDEGQNLGKSH